MRTQKKVASQAKDIFQRTTTSGHFQEAVSILITERAAIQGSIRRENIITPTPVRGLNRGSLRMESIKEGLSSPTSPRE